ncbi:peptidylprolyl isomerase [Achromobacter xylosoxidans]
MGVRPLDGWPDLFVKAVGNLQKGQVSALIQSGNGFHIIKVLDRGTAQPAPARTARAPAPAQAPQPKSQPQRAAAGIHAGHANPRAPHPDQDVHGHERPAGASTPGTGAPTPGGGRCQVRRHGASIFAGLDRAAGR